METVFDYLEQLDSELIKLRRELHKVAELGFQEFQTQSRIKSYLTDLGLEVETVAKTGVVALLDCGAGATIAFRADMDALPIQENNDLAYSSQNQGVMHACGHDGHMAILLILAKVLVKYQAELKGKIKFIFQPAEEGPGGAKPLIEAGVLKDPAVDRIFGLHLSNDLNLGEIGLKTGAVSAAADEIDITVKGEAGHVSHPEEGVDAITTTAHLITNLQTLITRQIDPNHGVTINLGTIRGGDRRNIIADEVRLEGTVRSTDPKLRAEMPKKIERVLKGVTTTAKAEFEYEYRFGYPVLINSGSVLKEIETELNSISYIKKLVNIKEPSLGSEDFAYYLKEVPGFFFRLGAGNKDQIYPCHNARFNFDEQALKVGVALFIKLALKFLAN